MVKGWVESVKVQNRYQSLIDKNNQRIKALLGKPLDSSTRFKLCNLYQLTAQLHVRQIKEVVRAYSRD